MITVTSRKDFLVELNKLIPQESSCVELGVYEGQFSRMILDVINPKQLVLVDPYIMNNDKTYGEKLNYSPTAYSTEDGYQELIRKFTNEIYSGQVSVIRKYSYEVVKFVPDNIYDVIYLDGSHLYFDVKKDLDEWLPKVKDNGFICGHDYIDFECFGVKEAVNDFCKENSFEILLFNVSGGDFAIQKNK